MATARNSLDKMEAGVSTRANFLSYFNSNMDIIDAAIAKCNWAAAADPTVNDDSDDGYAVGSWWNTTGHKLFQAESVAVGAAVWRQLYPVVTTIDVAASIHAADGKATPAEADEFGLVDTDAANLLKKITWTQKKAALKTYFDTIYPLRSLLTTRGDLYYRDAAGIARLAGVEQGSIFYEAAGLDPSWLVHADAGDLLQTAGHAANPSWISPEDITVMATGWLPAGETWTYASADAPSYTFTISGDKTSKYSAGMKIKLTQTSAKYFIITKVAYGSPNTTVTVYGGTDYALASAAITLPYYSMARVPVGFPLNPDKWTVEVIDTTGLTQATPTASVWYNNTYMNINIPIGCWVVSLKSFIYAWNSENTQVPVAVTLSTANNSESDANWTAGTKLGLTGAITFPAFGGVIFLQGIINLATKATYYTNIMTIQAGLDYIYGGTVASYGNGVIRAKCAYL